MSSKQKDMKTLILDIDIEQINFPDESIATIVLILPVQNYIAEVAPGGLPTVPSLWLWGPLLVLLVSVRFWINRVCVALWRGGLGCLSISCNFSQKGTQKRPIFMSFQYFLGLFLLLFLGWIVHLWFKEFLGTLNHGESSTPFSTHILNPPN